MIKREIRIGFDFDGVIAYSPTRLLRAPVSFIKRKLLKKKGVSFFVPKKRWQMGIWAAIFGPSVFPERGLNDLKLLAKNKKVHMHLITGRFNFLERSMNKWLDRQKVTKAFETININRNHDQPHQFKEKLIKEMGLDYFVEDNWDAVEYLLQNCPKTKILWIYNLVDRNIKYPLKFPHLERVLKYVREENSL